MTFLSTRNGNQPSSTIEIIGDHIVIRDLEIRHPEAASYLSQLPQSQQEPALLNCFEMGFTCIQVAQVRQDTALQENTEGIRAKAKAMKVEILGALTSVNQALNIVSRKT